MNHIVRAAVLLFFSLYVVSPLYASAAMGSEGKGWEHASPARTVSIGIVWVNILVSSFLDDDQEDGNAPRSQAFHCHQDNNLILIKIKRVLLRGPFEVKPCLETAVIPRSASELHIEVSRERQIPRNPLLREIEGYVSLNTGLSPPALLS